jgi:hypothetical protein
MNKCTICSSKIKGMARGVYAEEAIESKIITQKEFNDFEKKDLIESDGAIIVCKKCEQKVLLGLKKLELTNKKLPKKIIDFFYPENLNEIICVESKIFAIQPIILILFLSGISYLFLSKIELLPNGYHDFAFLAILFPILYSLLWFFWTIISYDTFLGKKGVCVEVKASNKSGVRTIHTFLEIPFKKIKGYLITKRGIKLIINKYNLLNTIFFIDLIIEKDSSEYELILDHLKEKNISLKNK